MTKLEIELSEKELENFQLLLDQCYASFDFSGDLYEIEEVLDKVYNHVKTVLEG